MLLYLEKTDPQQAFWDYMRAREEAARNGHPWRDGAPYPLVELITGDRTLVGPHTAKAVLDFLHGIGFRDNDQPNVRTPVRVVDFDGRSVVL